jgi:transposase-like protein
MILDPTIAKIVEIMANLPDGRKKEILEIINEFAMKDEPLQAADHEEPNPQCPHCNSSKVNKHGRTKLGFRCKCKNCSKTFSPTTGTVMYRSHSSKEKWIRAVRDTIDGTAIDKTAKALKINHSTAFNMRREILSAMEPQGDMSPAILSNICELDETYVLESLKGTKIPDDYYRSPRRHGSKAQKPGLSSEQICICTGIERNGGPCVAVSVNRATPSSEEILEAFNQHLDESALVLCDGSRSYKILGKLGCLIASIHDNEGGELHNINTVNRFHLFIKEYYDVYCGVATKYLNRYANMLSIIYRNGDWSDEDILRFLKDSQNFFNSVKDVKCKDLLLI